MMVSGDSASNRGRGQDVDLNLAPIIDCFTVLIAFMLVSASFLAIGIIDAGVAAGGTEAKAGTPPPVNVTVRIESDGSMELTLSGAESSKHKIAPLEKQGFDDLEKRLQGYHKKWPALAAVTLEAADGVEYGTVVRTMERIRRTIPVVMLGGF